MSRRLLTAVLVLGLSAAGGAARSAPAAGAEVSRVELSTPVLSLRRAPGLVARVSAISRLAGELDAAITEPALGGGRSRSCVDVRDTEGRPLYVLRPHEPLVPASTLKILTGAAVLSRLGPGHSLRTEVRSPGPPREGVVGDLWLVGGGDPLLSTADFAVDAGFAGQPRLATPLEALADSLVSAGVRRVDGRLLGDDSRYDRQRFVPTWLPRYLSEVEVSPISALVVNKSLFADRPRAFSSEPATHAANVLADLLRARGVSVAGTGEGQAPRGTEPLASVDSPPLADVVAEVLVHSDNLGAEMLVKELGVRFAGEGSTDAGLRVVRQELERMGLDLGALSATDGSGLDRSDSLTCDLLGDILAMTGEGSLLAKALPQAGGRGTLYRRFLGTPAAGRVRAKTGSLEGVVGLAGWATGADGRSRPFSLLANGLPRGPAGPALQDKVAVAVARFPRSPAPEQVRPLPPQPAPG